MKRLLLGALMVLVALGGMVGFSRAGEAVGTLQATDNASVPSKPKMYYLTKNTFNGGDAIKSCDPRFHMASISEIQDPSNMQYAASLSSAYAPARDQESVPPNQQDGWVRPGFSAALPADLLPMAQTNCDLSTTRTREVFGTTVHIPSPNVVPITNPWDQITKTQTQTRTREVFGTTVHIPSPNVVPITNPWDQITNPDALTLWIASPTPCEASVRVWCVEDPE
jgi:hypothetical protein